MTRSFLKATTALSVSLSLVHPGPVMAQAVLHAVPPEVCGSDATVCLADLIPVQTCAEDPTLADCPAPVPGAAPATEPDAAPVPEAAPAPDVVPAPDAAPEPDTVPVPDAAPTPEAAPADTGADVQAPVAPEVVPTPEAPAEVEQQPAAPAAAPSEAEPVPDAVPPVEDQTQAAPETGAVTPPEAAAPVPVPDDAGTAPAAVEVAPAGPPATEPAPGDTTAPDAAAPAVTTPETGATDEGAPVVEVPPVPAPTDESSAIDKDVAPGTPAVPADAAPDDAAAATPDAPPVADPVPEPTPEQAQVLETMLADPEVKEAVDTLSQAAPPATDATGEGAPVADAAASALGAMEAGTAAPPPAAVTTQTLGAAEARSSTQDFGTALVTAAPTEVKKKDRLSDLEKAGLLALGAVAVGMLINNSRVVANSGDRVVVDRGDGDLAIWKDDNANLRAPGVVETTQRYQDGSTLTTLERPDGSQIVTVRDATGRVIRRDRINRDGYRVPIIDDTRPYQAVDLDRLPRPRVRELRFVEGGDPALQRALLEQAEEVDLGRSYSLAQVRDIRQLRDLAPELTARPITFAAGSSAIRPEEAGKLAQIAGLMNDLIATNPAEVFLIEGHTDAVGGAAYNLALSDRRAESVALALTEIFGVPAENMVVQGYGERYLKVASSGDEARNRRVALRRITWLVDGS